MLGLNIIFTVAYFGVFCMGAERPGWPGYEYEADIGGWLKVHLEPDDWYTAKATCRIEGALLASPWSETFTSNITRIQASKSIPKMYSGVGLRKGSLGSPMNINEIRRCVVFLANGSTEMEICSEQLPFACYTPAPAPASASASAPASASVSASASASASAPSCGSGYEFHSETGNCYKLHKEPLLMADAVAACQSEGGYLAKLDGGEPEIQLMYKMIVDSGETIVYIANDDGGPAYRHMFNSSFSDYSCDIVHPFLCEKTGTNTGTDLKD